MKQATLTDVPTLVELMAEFYAEADFELNRLHAAEAFNALLDNAQLGSVWLIESEHQIAGHLVLTYRFGMEYGGMIACLDDLFVRSAFRNRGLSSQALATALEYCRKLGIRGLTVEVAPDNAPAQSVYRRAGFQALPDRQLLALTLAKLTHQA